VGHILSAFVHTSVQFLVGFSCMHATCNTWSMHGRAVRFKWVLFDFEICYFRKFSSFNTGCSVEYPFGGFPKGYSSIFECANFGKFLFLESFVLCYLIFFEKGIPKPNWVS
jgi:hypothetical protein